MCIFEHAQHTTNNEKMATCMLVHYGFVACFLSHWVAVTKYRHDEIGKYVNRLMWNKKPTRCHVVLYLFLLYKLLNMFRAALCPSSGADDLVVILPHVV